MGKVGLAITTYNRIDYLRTFVDSLLNSDLSKVDIICIVDDCSTENVKPILERVKAVYPEKTIILKTKLNSQIWITLKAAMDYLISEGCKTLINLDPDCILRKEWLNRVLDLHNRFPEDIVTGFNTLANHPIRETHEDYYVKGSCGGINMVYNINTYYDIIVPSFNTKTSWDTTSNGRTRAKRKKIIVTRPSVIQHIGSFSTMGHHGGDKALDFIEDPIEVKDNIEEEIIAQDNKDYITVVIPTMLRCPLDVFKYTLEQLNSNDFIRKIVIIDNTEDKSFDKFFSPTEKFVILKQPGNQGASYNSGMKICETKYYLLINDDVACRSNIINSCFEIMEKDSDIGLLQIETAIYQPLNVYISLESNKETSYIFPVNPRSCMTGWFQFGRTEDWVDIPKELKYFYGDDLLLEIMRYKKRKVARINSDHISHIQCSTSHSVIPPRTIHEEGKIYREVLKRICPR